MSTESHEQLLRERKQAWWTSVLAGPVDQPYPEPGSAIAARLDGDVLVVDGTVASEQDRQEIQQDVEQLIGHGIATVQCNVAIAPESEEEAGLLVQTLVGVFETEAQARFAASSLASFVQIQPIVLQVLAPGSTHPDLDLLQELVMESSWEDVQGALAENHAVMILTVDETQAFAAREFLDEETHSLKTTVLPPVTVAVARAVQAQLPDNSAPGQPLATNLPSARESTR